MRAIKLIAAITFTFTCLVTPAFAAIQPAVQISPLRSYPSQPPGITTDTKIKLINPTRTEVIVDLSIEHFYTINEKYDYKFDITSPEISWIKLDDKHVTLNPNESIDIPYTIGVPNTAQPGGYYFMIVAGVKINSGPASFTEINRVSSLVYLQIDGQILKKASLLGIDLPWITMSQNPNASIRVSNDGTTHERLGISINAKSMVIGSSKSQTIENLILPKTIRKIDTKLSLPLMPGLYTITTSFSPPQGGPQITQSHRIIYLPVWFIISLSAAVVLSIHTLRLKRR